MKQKIKELLRKEYRKRGLFYIIARTVLGDWHYPYLCIHSLIQMTSKDPIVHVIGDSHTKSFEYQDKFICHHVGQATAHNLYKPNNSSNSREILSSIVKGLPRQDIILLVFGEIDARIHIYNQHKKTGRHIPDLIWGTVANYSHVFKGLRNIGYKVAILGIPPAGSQDNIYKYPYYGSPKERSEISNNLNQALRTFCKANDILYIDVHSLTKDDKGMIKKEWARDETHLNSGIVPYVREKLREHFTVDHL